MHLKMFVNMAATLLQMWVLMIYGPYMGDKMLSAHPWHGKVKIFSPGSYQQNRFFFCCIPDLSVRTESPFVPAFFHDSDSTVILQDVQCWGL